MLIAWLNWLEWSQWWTYAILGGIFIAVILGTWAGAVASGKGRNMQVWFLIGFFIPIIGLVASYLVKPIEKKPGSSGGK